VFGRDAGLSDGLQRTEDCGGCDDRPNGDDDDACQLCDERVGDAIDHTRAATNGNSSVRGRPRIRGREDRTDVVDLQALLDETEDDRQLCAGKQTDDQRTHHAATSGIAGDADEPGQQAVRNVERVDFAGFQEGDCAEPMAPIAIIASSSAQRGRGRLR